MGRKEHRLNMYAEGYAWGLAHSGQMPNEAFFAALPDEAMRTVFAGARAWRLGAAAGQRHNAQRPASASPLAGQRGKEASPSLGTTASPT